MKLTLKIWRQSGPNDKGRMETYPIDGIEEDMSFLEMIDVLNLKLVREGKDPVAFDHDCREGICGSCSMFINGAGAWPGPWASPPASCTCASFKDGDTIHIEPWRSAAFPVVKDLVVDRSAFDRIQAAGGFISVNTSGNLVDGNATPVPQGRCR